MNGTMKAVIFEKAGQYAVVDKPIPQIKRPNELLVRIDACSICGTDMQILKDPPGIEAVPGVTIGHEMVGTVVETGEEVKNFKVGDRVTADNNVPCGQCYYCKTGHSNMCENLFCLGIDGDGFFAQYAVIPDQLAVGIDQNLPLDTAIFTEPLNCVMSGMDKIRLLPGETAVVIGAGPIGLYYIQLLKLNGAGKVIAVELNDFRKEYASRLGADLVISPSEAEKIMEVTKGLGADVVIDAVGACIKDAIAWVRSSGRVLLFGLNFAAQQTICQTNITRKDLTVMGCYIGTYTWKKTVQLLENVPMKLEDMITHRLSLEEFGKGFEAMKDGSALEVVMYPNGR
ncbi:MAG: alcohol dehydrogenase catalytic domain-containing protein [Ruminococcus sp.]